MSEQRNGRNASGVDDPQVTAAYRDVATERAPASLNERVLRDAATHVGSGYSRWILWLRPVAWAATIGLSLAIVIELAVLPNDIESVAPPVAEPQSRDESDILQQDVAPVPQRGRLDSADEAAHDLRLPAAAPPEAAKREMAKPDAAEPPAAGSGFGDTDAFAITNAPILEEAEDIARMQSVPEQRAQQSLSSKAASLARQAQDDAASCDAASRATREAWLACIEALEEEGRAAEAEAERALLQEAFPEAPQR